MFLLESSEKNKSMNDFHFFLRSKGSLDKENFGISADKKPLKHTFYSVMEIFMTYIQNLLDLVVNIC